MLAAIVGAHRSLIDANGLLLGHDPDFRPTGRGRFHVLERIGRDQLPAPRLLHSRRAYPVKVQKRPVGERPRPSRLAFFRWLSSRAAVRLERGERFVDMQRSKLAALDVA
ncbi:hypothetical protein, partial [Mesorhizobium sp. M1E.F.Ca.ET.041.01.1.1]|uniref:hypothetical protein n=1 Tax=Mesorhizobium sp. M1E.F.Ca.ET.041.01.1.1 TaxID=2496759 RepID=UPI001677C187